MQILTIGLFGALGTLARYFAFLWFRPATLFVNVLGCLFVGMIGALVKKQAPHYESIYLLGAIGFLGSFTTFSAFGLETVQMLEESRYSPAIINIALNLVLGLLAVWVGKRLTLLL